MTELQRPAIRYATQDSRAYRLGLPVALFTVVLEVALLFSWCAGYVGTRFGVDMAPPYMLLFWRSVASAAVLLPLAWRGLRKLRAADVARQAAFGMFGMSTYMASFTLAIHQGASTAVVALIMDLLPVAVALLSWPVLGVALTRRQWAGTALGALGIWIAADLSGGGGAPAHTYAFPVLGTLATAFISLLQTGRRQVPVLQALFVQCLMATLVFGIAAQFEGGLQPVPTWRFASAIAWLVLFASFGSWGLYYLALRYLPASRVTGTLFLSPPLTAVWAWAVFDEPLSISLGVGFLVALGGLLLARHHGQREPSSATSPEA